MEAASIDVLCIGNAIVDVLGRVDEAFLAQNQMAKGAMALVDEGRAESIYAAMSSTIEVSGGSAANTAVGVAAFGGRAAFVGCVKTDALGTIFRHDIEKADVSFRGRISPKGLATARCCILVTPDGERTMNTYLGAAQLLSADDIDPAAIADAAITYLEGYLWDPPQAKEAFSKAAALAHAHGRRVALTLSDVFCVDRWRDEFLALLRQGKVDLLFANEAELHSLYQTADFATALSCVRRDVSLAVVTCGERGAVIISAGGVQSIDAWPVDRVVDSTGAGDLFAAGFLYGHSRDLSHKESARLGALAASEIISHLGARPERNLASLAAENGLGQVEWGTYIRSENRHVR